MLLATPLIKGLKLACPDSRVSIGVGSWAKTLLQNNPYVDEIIDCNAPWHNKQNCRFPANSIKTFWEGLSYVLFSKEARYISKRNFTLGIDVLGSRQGSWLMCRADIPVRFGVKGYAGGDNWTTNYIDFREDRNVAESSLEFLNLMNFKVEIDKHPEIYLKKYEYSVAHSIWKERNLKTKRIIVAPGSGFPEKCWGDHNFTQLTKLILKNENFHVCIIGANEDKNRIALGQKSNLNNLCGELSLRQSAALASQADFIISNSSLCMHLAGAFNKPSIIVLSQFYDSAELHKKQWGYSNSLVLGKESLKGLDKIVSPEFVLANMKEMLGNE